MNQQLLEDYEESQKRSTIKMLKALMKRIERDQLKVTEHGFWEGSNGKWNFMVSTRESDNFRPFTEI